MKALPAETIRLPFEAGPFRMAMGLLARDPDEAIEIDDRYLPEMAERRRLLAERRGEVFAALPGSEAACRDTLDRLADLLPRRFPDWFERRGTLLHNQITGESWDLAGSPANPLEIAARLVQEDLCLLEPSPDGPRLIAAALCFPSRWRLGEKIGHPLMAIHGPVPFYGERLGRPVDRLIGTLKQGKLVERFNWSLLDDAALFQPFGHGRTSVNPAITARSAGETIFLRVERQTLSLLPTSGAVLFTIRVHVTPLHRAIVHPETAARLAEAVRALPDDMLRYKSVGTFRDALLDWLQETAATPTADLTAQF